MPSARPAARAPSRVASARAGGGAAVQPRDVAQQGRKRRRRRADEIGDRLRPPARLDESFAKMEEVALDLRLAGAPQVLARNRHALERIGSEHALVRAQDFGVLERKRVERPAKLLVGQDERNRQLRGAPIAGRACARSRSLMPSESTSGEAGERGVAVAFDARTIGDQGSKTAGEDAPQVGDERSGRVPPRIHGSF